MHDNGSTTFGSSQLSQFMDQTNPLSEVTHKQQISLWSGWSFAGARRVKDSSDVRYHHYGRICPIETPEGPNIGLISSLSCYARLNAMGYIESPYKKVEKGRVQEHVEITQVGDGGYALGAVVVKEEFKTNAKLKKKAGKVEAWSPTPSTSPPGGANSRRAPGEPAVGARPSRRMKR